MTVRTHLTGSTLVRLLGGLTGPRQRVRDARISFADALNQWTGWTASIALSKALDQPVAVAAGVPGSHAAEQAECLRVHALQAQAIEREAAAAGRGPLDEGMGFAPFRQCYLARQQAMETAIGPLRERVRAALAACSAEAARLAGVDAVMAEVLAPQERRLLATVPVLLGRHFARLCEDAGQAEGEGAARELLRRDLRAVLLAELELRLQPVQGLLEALRQYQHQPQGGA